MNVRQIVDHQLRRKSCLKSMSRTVKSTSIGTIAEKPDMWSKGSLWKSSIAIRLSSLFTLFYLLVREAPLE